MHKKESSLEQVALKYVYSVCTNLKSEYRYWPLDRDLDLFLFKHKHLCWAKDL